MMQGSQSHAFHASMKEHDLERPEKHEKGAIFRRKMSGIRMF